MSDPTIQRFVIQWRDLDANGHMRNTAYLDYATQARFAFFATHGFPLSEFRQLSLGPITLRDEITYVREVHMLETIESRLHATNWSDDGSRFRLVNDIVNRDGNESEGDFSSPSVKYRGLNLVVGFLFTLGGE